MDDNFMCEIGKLARQMYAQARQAEPRFRAIADDIIAGRISDENNIGRQLDYFLNFGADDTIAGIYNAVLHRIYGKYPKLARVYKRFYRDMWEDRNDMSGGFFEYQDMHLANDMAEELRLELAKARQKPEWLDFPPRYSDAFIAEMSRAYNKLKELAVQLHRIDWVLSGDDGEDDYFRRLAEDMANVQYDDESKDEAILAEEKARIDYDSNCEGV